MARREQKPLTLMLCALTDDAGGTPEDDERTRELSARLEEALRRTLRSADVVCRYSRCQFLVLLFGAAEKDCAAVRQRIRERFSPAGKAELRFFTEEV